MVSPATRIEFFRAVSIPAKLAKKVRLPRSNSGMNGLGKLFTVSGELSVLISRKYSGTMTQAQSRPTALT